MSEGSHGDGGAHRGDSHGGDTSYPGGSTAPVPTSNVQQIASAAGDVHHLPSGHEVVTIVAAWDFPAPDPGTIEIPAETAAASKRPLIPKDLHHG